jgi:hypothetical protein
VAARGLDIHVPKVDLVIQCEPPKVMVVGGGGGGRERAKWESERGGKEGGWGERERERE